MIFGLTQSIHTEKEIDKWNTHLILILLEINTLQSFGTIAWNLLTNSTLVKKLCLLVFVQYYAKTMELGGMQMSDWEPPDVAADFSV